MELFFFVWLYLSVQMLGAWMLYRFLNNPTIVDIAWVLGLLVAGLIYLAAVPLNFRIMLMGGLLIVWALRLGGYLWFTRVRKGIVDNRFILISEKWHMPLWLSSLLNFQLQALFILVLSSVFLLGSQTGSTAMSSLDWLAFVLVLLGIVGESFADMELYHFKQDHQGQVCYIGLWKYCRHPNYFFEWVVWCGFSAFSLGSDFELLGLASPLLLYTIVTQITGPMTERESIAVRGQAYRDYQRTTNMFFPWFPSK